MRWKTKSFTDLSGYSFTYDGVNRLKTTDYSLNGTWGKTDNTETNFRYDANGNITYMERYAANNTKIDALTYNYKAGSNQIDYITDASNNATGYKPNGVAGNYTYDANGNMKLDKIKGIKNGISYNYLNLPLLVDLQNGQKITYLYTATGVKLRKMVVNGTQQNDKSFDYVGNFVYDLNGSLKYILFDEGRINVQADGSYQYEYQLKDHLVNVRATFAVINNAAVEQQENAYYPFGMSISELAYNANTSTTNVVNKYLYNGKEMQDDFGLDWLDYGFRMMDPVVGRWWVQDLLMEEHAEYTPYHYCFNNPINFIDPLGLDTGVVRIEDGKKVAKDIKEVIVTPKDDDNSKSKIDPTNLFFIALTTGTSGTITGIQEYSNVKNNMWKAANGTWYTMQGSQRKIAKQTVVKRAYFYNKLGKKIFVAGVIISSAQATIAIYNGDYYVAGKCGLDVTMSSVATFGGPTGLAVGTIYFLLDAGGVFNQPIPIPEPDIHELQRDNTILKLKMP
jgi:RHS repeat-associated protein